MPPHEPIHDGAVTAAEPDSTTAPRGLYVKTWGCQMNMYDSARMIDVLRPLGYRPVDTLEQADMAILNTCHIREKATEKLYSELGRLRADKQASGRKLVVAVTGCVAQAEGEEILRRAAVVDLVVGSQSYHRLPELVERANRAAGVRLVDTDFPVESKFDLLPDATVGQGPVAMLAVQEGCDKFCSFCVVPYTRGAEFSRPALQIVAEAERLVAAGAHEIVLVGQNVNAWHGDGPDGSTWGLGQLIGAVAKVEGLRQIRYTTSHPRDMAQDLIDAHRDEPKLMPFLHLPVQSGSDRMLAAMNRKHTADEYRRIIERLRIARPDLGFSSDFIVGHPGETEADFEATLALVREIGFASAYCFSYSPRPGTPASALTTQVPEAVKSERLQRLQATVAEGQIAFNESTVGRIVPVLLDRPGRRERQLHGRTPWQQSIHVEADPRLLGKFVDVRIDSARPNSVAGTVVTPEVVQAA